MCVVFFFNDTATTEIYTSCHTLSLHDALPICGREIRTRHRDPLPPTYSVGGAVEDAGAPARLGQQQLIRQRLLPKQRAWRRHRTRPRVERRGAAVAEARIGLLRADWGGGNKDHAADRQDRKSKRLKSSP